VHLFLTKYQPDVAKVNQALPYLAQLQPPDLFHKLATFALASKSPGSATNLLNLGVELAYEIWKSKTQATAAVTPELVAH